MFNHDFQYLNVGILKGVQHTKVSLGYFARFSFWDLRLNRSGSLGFYLLKFDYKTATSALDWVDLLSSKAYSAKPFHLN